MAKAKEQRKICILSQNARLDSLPQFTFAEREALLQNYGDFLSPGCDLGGGVWPAVGI